MRHALHDLSSTAWRYTTEWVSRNADAMTGGAGAIVPRRPKAGWSASLAAVYRFGG